MTHSHIVKMNVRETEVALREADHSNAFGVRQRSVFQNQPTRTIAAFIVKHSHLHQWRRHLVSCAVSSVCLLRRPAMLETRNDAKQGDEGALQAVLHYVMDTALIL